MRQLCFLLVVCCAAAIGPALAPAAAQQRVILTPDADYPEHDIGTVDGVDLDGCQQACLAEPRCLAFTHDASARRCYLKNDHGELRSMPGATAGRLVEGAALTPSLERQRLSELGFLDDGLKVEARRFAEALPARFAAGEMSFGALAAAAEAAWRAGNRAEAVSLYGRALSRAPEDYGVWVRFAGALIAYEPDDWQQRQQNERDAVSAAIQSYLLATDDAQRANSLALLGSALAQAQRWRMAIQASRQSLALVEEPVVREAYDRLVAEHGFRIVSHQVDADAPSPRICLVFSEELPRDRGDIARFVQVRGVAGAAVEAADNQVCVDGVRHGERYHLTVRPGLPSAAGETIERQVDLDIYVRDRAPSVRFTGRAYVLPRGGDASIPVVTVNTDLVEAEVYRVGDRGITGEVTDGRFLRQLDGWSAEQLAERSGERVWAGTIEVRSELNRDITTAIPIGEVVRDIAPGAYVMTAKAANARDEYWSERATQWFIVTDLGLVSMKGADGVHAFVRSLSTAAPVAGAEVRLVARNNEVLATATTDDNGHAGFAPGLSRGTGGMAPALLVAEGADGDYAFLDLTTAAFDLTDRGVDGRPAPQALDVFAYTERGVYRAGETVHTAAIVRDTAARAVTGVPLTIVYLRPDGVEHARATLTGDRLGGHAHDLALRADAMRGTWTIRLHADPEAPPLAEKVFLVEDFEPERLAFELASEQDHVAAGGTVPVSLAARYLYGAPAADLAVEAEVTVAAVEASPEAFPGYRFGLADETFRPVREPVDTGVRTGAEGEAAFPVSLPETPATTRLLAATVTARVREAGGRAVERSLTLPVRTGEPRIGIRPLFAANRVEEGAQAGFEVIVASPDGSRLAADGLAWTLYRLETNFQWFRQDGRWSYESVTRTVRVTDGRIDVAAGMPARVDLPVGWGRYRFEVEAGSASAAVPASVEFDAGWFAAAGTAETPDVLRIAADRPAYRPGEIARIHIEPRFAGAATIAVVNERLIETRTIDLPAEGTTVELQVTDDWGVGAYVTAIAFRPMDLEQRRMPSRALGLVWVGIDPADRRLALAIDAPDEIVPGETLATAVTVDGLAAGEQAYVTIAAVDLGILNLTRFEPPAPDAWYLGQRALGAEIRDLYGQLIDRMQGVRGRVRSGGDEGGMQIEGPPPTDDLVAFFSGILEADDAGRAEASFDLPRFSGTVRLMAVAWTANGVGHAARDVLVRDDVVLTASLPRFLAPGDRSRILIEVANVDGPAGTYQLDVAATGGVEVDAGDAHRLVELGSRGRSVVAVPISAVRPEPAEIVVTASSLAGRVFEERYTLPVRSTEPPVTRRDIVTLDPGTGRLALDDGALAGFIEGTGSLTVSASAAGRLDVPGLLSALDRFPYGCAEQLASRALPLVYLDEVALAAGLEGDADASRRLRDAIAGVLAKQSASGSFGLWAPGGGDFWLDAYVTDFLTRARERGYEVPAVSFDLAVANLLNRLAYAGDFDRGGEDVAYALYVLARNGRASIGDLRYYGEVKLGSFATPLAKAQVAAALALYGDRERAAGAFQQAVAAIGEPAPSGFRADYGSALRDGAAVLALAAETDAPGVNLAQLGARLAVERGRVAATSTQENAWLLLAAHAVIEAAGDDRIAVDGAVVTGPVFRRYDAADLAGAAVRIENLGDRPVDAVVTATGIPQDPEPAGGAGMAIERSYYTLSGEPADVATVAQNDRLVTVIEVSILDDDPGRTLVVDRLPAGFEIDNPNLVRSGDISSLGWLDLDASPAHVEFRADRFVAALEPDRNLRSFRLAYIVRAVAPGTFAHPAATVEDMYRPHLNARTASGRTEVVGPLR